jgi:hypothetical protein
MQGLQREEGMGKGAVVSDKKSKLVAYLAAGNALVGVHSTAQASSVSAALI